MEHILAIAEKYNLFVIEDNAQALGCSYHFSNRQVKRTGTIGHIGCTSFFPSKNLGCFGDGGAIMTDDDTLANKIRMIANHGQSKKYYHSILGCNSRLDTLQAEVLKIKLKYLDEYTAARNKMADYYDTQLSSITGIEVPARTDYSNHVFHQYTLKVKDNKRDDLKQYLEDRDIPTMIYYPLPLYKQDAFVQYTPPGYLLPVTEQLCSEVLSLPIHTEYDEDILDYIVKEIKLFFKK